MLERTPMESGETTIGPYRVVRRLGVGGMAETFEAERVLSASCRLEVCIKRVLPAYGEDADYLAMFRREARLASTLRHPNVVGVVDAGDDHGQPYLVLELVDGIDLRALLAAVPDRKLPEAVVTLLATELAYALAYAHAPDGERPGLVHRDVSPSNVLLSRGGDVKLADFGIAKPMHGAVATQSGAIRGKIPYLAPELMRGERVDGRADLFSLGVVLYECLAGLRPFDGAHDIETMGRIVTDRRVPLRTVAPEVDGQLAAIVDRLLASNPDDRFADADALLDALDALAPPANARFTLLDLVEGRLGGPEARRHVRGPKTAHDEVSDDVSDATRRIRRPPGAADTAQRPTAIVDPLPLPVVVPERSDLLAHAPEEKTWRASRWLVPVSASVVAMALVGLGVGLGTLSPRVGRVSVSSASMHPSEAAAPATLVQSTPTPRLPEPAVAPVPASTVSIPSTPAVSSARVETSSRPERRTTARVRVVVLPWGKVWVDGIPRGRAPTVLTLEAGSHRIAAGQERPSIERRIRLSEGEARTLELELDE